MEYKLYSSEGPLVSKDRNEQTVVEDLLAALECCIQYRPYISRGIGCDLSHDFQKVIHDMFRQRPFTAKPNDQIKQVKPDYVD
jgi:hypothetical protein